MLNSHETNATKKASLILESSVVLMSFTRLHAVNERWHKDVNERWSPEARLDSSPVLVMQRLIGRAGVQELFHNCWCSCQTNEHKSERMFSTFTCVCTSVSSVHITTKNLSLWMANISNKNVALCIQILIFFFCIKFFYIWKQKEKKRKKNIKCK